VRERERERERERSEQKRTQGVRTRKPCLDPDSIEYTDRMSRQIIPLLNMVFRLKKVYMFFLVSC
jgi:hypothetical protein